MKNALEGAGLKPEVAEVTMRPENTIELPARMRAKMQKLLDVLEDLDDVQDVFHNAAIECRRATLHRLACQQLVTARSAMKVLVIGGGGREHALAWKLAQSPKLQASTSPRAMAAPRSMAPGKHHHHRHTAAPAGR